MKLIRKLCSHTYVCFLGICWLVYVLHHSTFPRYHCSNADITGLVQSSFCPPSSGHSASTPHTLNLTVNLSSCLANTFVKPTSSLSLPLSCYSGSSQVSIFISTTSVSFCCNGASESNLQIVYVNSAYQ